MNILIEIADKDLIFLALAFLALIIFGVIIFYVISKNNKVEPLEEYERYDYEEEEEDHEKQPRELTEDQKKAKAELERVYAMMSEDLEKQELEEPIKEEVQISDIYAFEREQEENAIISYQELIRQTEAKQKLRQTAETHRETYKDESYSKNNYPETNEKESLKEQLNFEIEKPKQQPKKFRNSEIISPIFGIQSEGKHVQRQTFKPKKETIQKTDETENNEEFLNSLKEFRKKL